MFIEVFNPINDSYSFESVAIIDRFKNLTVEENWTNYNTFSLTLPFVKDGDNLFHLLEPESVIRIEDCYYYVDRLTCNEQDIEVQGKSLSAKGNHRLIHANYNKQMQVHKIIEDLISRYMISGNHPIQYLSLIKNSNLTTSTIRFQQSYGEVMEEVNKLLESYDLGFYEQAEANYPKNSIKLSKGNDLSEIVEFSEVNENLTSLNFEHSNFDEKTVAYVFGEGEGDNRKNVVINNSVSGLARKELYVDARDLQKENDGVTLSDADYLNLLRNRGYEKLAERKKVFQLTGTIDAKSSLFKLGEDYDLGDRVKIHSKLFNVKYTTQITQIKKTWNEQGYHVDPTFGNSSPTVYDILKRGR